MLTSLSLPHTLALSASLTLHPTAISAGSFPLFFASSLLSALHISPLPSTFFSRFLFFPGSPLILSQTRRLCFVSPQTLASSPRPWSWTANASIGTTLPSSPPREVRGHFVRHFTPNTRALDYMELKPSSETIFLLPLTPAATDEREGRGGLREFKLCIVQSLKSTASCECCTSLSSLALDSSSHERNAVWRHKQFDTACLRIDLYCASYLMLQ